MAKFEVGNPGGPGRPKGSYGRRHKALAVLDDVLSEEETLKRLEQALREAAHADPIHFFRTIVMPLIPKSALQVNVDVDSDARRYVYDAILQVSQEQAKGGGKDATKRH